jgi:hypothetical protein
VGSSAARASAERDARHPGAAAGCPDRCPDRACHRPGALPQARGRCAIPAASRRIALGLGGLPTWGRWSARSGRASRARWAGHPPRRRGRRSWTKARPPPPQTPGSWGWLRDGVGGAGRHKDHQRARRRPGALRAARGITAPPGPAPLRTTAGSRTRLLRGVGSIIRGHRARGNAGREPGTGASRPSAEGADAPGLGQLHRVAGLGCSKVQLSCKAARGDGIGALGRVELKCREGWRAPRSKRRRWGFQERCI